MGMSQQGQNNNTDLPITETLKLAKSQVKRKIIFDH